MTDSKTVNKDSSSSLVCSLFICITAQTQLLAGFLLMVLKTVDYTYLAEYHMVLNYLKMIKPLHESTGLFVR